MRRHVDAGCAMFLRVAEDARPALIHYPPNHNGRFDEVAMAREMRGL